MSSRGSAEVQCSNGGTTFALTEHVPYHGFHLTSASGDPPQALPHLDFDGTGLEELIQGQSTSLSSDSRSTMSCCAVVAGFDNRSEPVSRCISSPQPIHAHAEKKPPKVEVKGKISQAPKCALVIHPMQDHTVSRSTAIATAITGKLSLQDRHGQLLNTHDQPASHDRFARPANFANSTGVILCNDTSRSSRAATARKGRASDRQRTVQAGRFRARPSSELGTTNIDQEIARKKNAAASRAFRRRRKERTYITNVENVTLREWNGYWQRRDMYLRSQIMALMSRAQTAEDELMLWRRRYGQPSAVHQSSQLVE